MEDKPKKKKITFFMVFKRVLKRVKISSLIMLIVTLASTSFAWFIYATKVSAGITAHIETWDVRFLTEDNQISETINIVISNLYPGMPDFSESITAYNQGEKQASISYQVTNVKILGVSYDTTSNATIINRLATEFPFHITFNLDNQVLSASNGTSTFTVGCTWPFDSGNDVDDTYWGKRSYTFSSNNPDQPSIELTVVISAIQNND